MIKYVQVMILVNFGYMLLMVVVVVVLLFLTCYLWNCMIIFGLISSGFDFLIFWVFWVGFYVGVDLFCMGWFIELIMIELMVMFVLWICWFVWLS